MVQRAVVRRGYGSAGGSGGFNGKVCCSFSFTRRRARGRGRMATGLIWGTEASRSATFPRGRLCWSGVSPSLSDFLGFCVRLPAARAGELYPGRGWRRAITKTDSKLRSLDFPVLAGRSRREFETRHSGLVSNGKGLVR